MIQLTNLTYLNAIGILKDDCASDYEMNEGLEVIPLMGPRDTPPKIVRLHAAYTVRRSKFEYARTKVPPPIPAPGDTLRGDTFIGGNIRVNAPAANADTDLVYEAGGQYTFVTATDVRTDGKIRFDAHGYESKVDFLGWFNLARDPKIDDTWNSPLFDLNILGSARILG